MVKCPFYNQNTREVVPRGDMDTCQEVDIFCDGEYHRWEIDSKYGGTYEIKRKCPQWLYEQLTKKIKTRFPNQHKALTGETMSVDNFDFFKVILYHNGAPLHDVKENLPFTLIPGKTESFQKLFVCGNSGVGKTHLAISILQLIFDEKPYKKIEMISAPGDLAVILSKMNYSYREDGEYGKLYERIIKSDFLLIDDLGAEVFKFASEKEVFQGNLLNLLNDFAGVLIVTCNMPIQELPYDERIKTRLRLRCHEYGVVAKGGDK